VENLYHQTPPAYLIKQKGKQRLSKTFVSLLTERMGKEKTWKNPKGNLKVWGKTGKSL
jgi:hypothetical protein